MRGKGWQVGFQHASERITPACAGKSPASGPGCGKTGDHPRVCGEKTRYQNLKTTIQGSPPRVRGKVWDILQPLADWGITPACAGKSCLAAIYAYNEGDHPRVCGEKSVPLRCSISAVGSPPRVRGKAGQSQHPAEQSGITPACAGKRPCMMGAFCPLKDHPRVCGEKS